MFIKILVNEPGLKAIKELKREGVRITATAIYSTFKGYLTIAKGVDILKSGLAKSGSK